MGRRSGTRRKTFWEGAEVPITLSDSAINGGEMLGIVQLNDFAPATLVRIRGIVECQWATVPTVLTTNLVATVRCAIRKVSLARTTDAYAVPTGNLFDEAYLSGEDILWMGSVLLSASALVTETDPSPDTLRAIQRGAGVLDFDVKAMRKFDSAEERLVFEAQVGFGQVTSIDCEVRVGARMLFKAG